MSYDAWQQTFGLAACSALCNTRKGMRFTLQRYYQDAVLKAIPHYGNWSVVWGPVVWKKIPSNFLTGPDNSWFCAYNPSLLFEDGKSYPTYVVAIAPTAGTAMYSHDWREEDFGVDEGA